MNFPWKILLGTGMALMLSAAGPGADAVQTVIWTPVRESGLVATMLRPKGEATLPAVIVVGGSEGGLRSAESLAYRFAERGWGALALAYFGVETLPPKLANVPLEYFDTAVNWIKRQPRLQTGDLGIVGTSRGAELALLLASHNPAFTRVVAIAPSHVVWGPVGVFTDQSISVWALGGKPLAYLQHVREPDYSAKPYRGTPNFMADLGQPALAMAAAIPVEKIQGAVLFLSGEDDQVWPSALMARLAMKRLAEAKHPYRFEHVSYPGSGHLIAPGSAAGLIEAKHPTGVVMAFGGSKRANLAAQEQAWAKMVDFLRADIRATGASTNFP